MLSLKNFIKKLCLDRNNVEPEPLPEPDLVDYEVINDLTDTECIICLGSFKSVCISGLSRKKPAPSVISQFNFEDL